MGKLDILFNNAGICVIHNNADISHVREDIFDLHMNTNVKSVWLGIRNAAAELVKTKGRNC